ncbi:MAG: helix-turn-helix domain-containing protein [Methanobacterium sp.]
MPDEVYINEPLSSRIIMEILEEHPNIKRIKCPTSLYLRTSKKYLDALHKLGVEVEPVIKSGRPKKYGESEVKLIQKMLKNGSNPSEISEKLRLPIKTVYYLKETPLKRGRKPKYTLETEEEIRRLHAEGLRVKEISERLGIPLRTVYSIIKK